MDKEIPKDVMKMILDYYLCDYTWISIGLGKHIAHNTFICCNQCKNINGCKASIYHNSKSAIKNIFLLPSLKRVSKFWDFYITKWFVNEWQVKTWKKLHHINSMVKNVDKLSTHDVIDDFFTQLFGIINSSKTFPISIKTRNKHSNCTNVSVYLTLIKINNNKLSLICKQIDNTSNGHELKKNFTIVQDENEDFGWFMDEKIFTNSRNIELNICDIMSLLHLPHVSNMIDPSKINKLKIRYYNKTGCNFYEL